MVLTPSTSERFRTVLRGLLAVLGAWRVEPRVAAYLYNRVGLIAGRIERMLVRFRAGRLWRVRQRVSPQRPRMRRKPAIMLPRRFGWLVLAGGHQAAAIGSQLQTVLDAPDMAALLAASPAAMRLLRPLCRALAMEWPERVARARKPSTRTPLPRPEPEPFKIPLPRGVITWARREGFGKLS